MNNKLSMLGLARRAGKLACGMRLCEDAIKKGHAYLVIIATDASDSTKKSITDCCNYYKVRMLTAFDKESIGKITGTEICAVAAIMDKNFADGIKNISK